MKAIKYCLLCMTRLEEMKGSNTSLQTGHGISWSFFQILRFLKVNLNINFCQKMWNSSTQRSTNSTIINSARQKLKLIKIAFFTRSFLLSLLWNNTSAMALNQRQSKLKKIYWSCGSGMKKITLQVFFLLVNLQLKWSQSFWRPWRISELFLFPNSLKAR